VVSDPRRFQRLPLISALITVALAATLPVVFTRRFYFWDDTAGAWFPGSRRIGELLRSGELPFLDLSLWRGGNFVAEAGYGLWNPLVLLADLTLLQMDDMEIASALLKGGCMLALVLGVYLLGREYGASAWPSSLIAAAVPLSGFTLWMDATSWTANHLAFVLTPYVWLTARRVAGMRCGPAWLVLAGFLCVSAGNPYSNAIVLVLVLGVALEQLAVGDRTRLIPLGGALVAIGLTALVVYLPFRQAADVGYRTTNTFNDEFMSPGLTDLANLSTSSLTPYVTSFGLPRMTFPGAYLAWFVLPLIPWMSWRPWRALWREKLGLLVVGGILLALTLGPSNFWFFRWPARLIPYVLLPVAVGWAVTLSFGLVRTRPLLRALLSAGIVVGGAYLAWADVPQHLGWHALGAFLLAVLPAATLMVAHPTRRSLLMMAGSVAVLTVQLQWMPTNGNVTDYHFPASASEIGEDFDGRYVGNTIQIAATGAVPPGELQPGGVYNDLLFGSMYTVAGVESTTAYSGIGFAKLDGALCILYQGGTCVEAWNQLWLAPAETDRRLVDLLRAETIVVQKALIDTSDAPAPDGWSIAEVTEHVVVWRRLEPLRWPNGRLATVSGPLDVVSDTQQGSRRELVEVAPLKSADGTDASSLTFSRLAWPGYSASLNGRPLTVRSGPAGLVTVDLPAGVGAGIVELRWRPPGLRAGLAGAAAGVVVTVVLQVFDRRSRRSRGVRDGALESKRASSAADDPTDANECGHLLALRVNSDPAPGSNTRSSLAWVNSPSTTPVR